MVPAWSCLSTSNCLTWRSCGWSSGAGSMSSFRPQQRSVARTCSALSPGQYAICLHEAGRSAPGILPDADTVQPPRASCRVDPKTDPRGGSVLPRGIAPIPGPNSTRISWLRCSLPPDDAHPRASCLVTRTCAATSRASAAILPIRPGEKLLSILPMHHTFENTRGSITCFIAAAAFAQRRPAHFMKNMPNGRSSHDAGRCCLKTSTAKCGAPAASGKNCWSGFCDRPRVSCATAASICASACSGVTWPPWAVILRLVVVGARPSTRKYPTFNISASIFSWATD